MSDTRSPDQDYKNFLTAVGRAPGEGYTPYWLGRSFSAGGLTFAGPSVSDLDIAGQPGTIGATYDAVARPDGGRVTLSLASYSGAAWASVSRHVLPEDKPGAKDTTKKLLGQQARLRTVASATRPVNARVVAIPLGGTTVVAMAIAGGSATPGGPDANPLIDEQTFLSVLQHLRPYPQ
jgi:hypothetical protein